MTDEEIITRLDDMRMHVNAAENSLATALRRIDKFRAELLASAPTPAPTPTPEPMTPDLDVIYTRSGTWRVNLIQATPEFEAAGVTTYDMTLDQMPGFRRRFWTRRAFTKEAGDTTALDLFAFEFEFSGEQITIPQGGFRVWQNISPVTPRADWLREAVAARLIPAYRRERAWFSFAFELLAPDPTRAAPYNPASLGSTTKIVSPTSNSNYVGTTSGQGGEYPSSRGFLHDADARVLDAALHNEDELIAEFWPEFERYTLYSLSQPQGAVWSPLNHITADPQFPFDGDRQYENPLWVNPKPEVDSLLAVDAWGRDVAHLENTGFVHWLATGDPIAGILLQRQAAYALASWYENYRKPGDATYKGGKDQERGMFNTLSALWKSLAVSEHTKTRNGHMIWSLDRARKQAADVIADFDAYSLTVNPYLKVFGGVFGNDKTGIYEIDDPDTDGGTATVTHTSTSAFELAQYGKEPLWLWARAGYPAALRWLVASADQAAARFGLVGGAAGVDGIASSRGSGFPIGPTMQDGKGYTVPTSPTPFADLAGWAEWFLAQPWKAKPSRDDFNDSSVHTAMQLAAVMDFAADVGWAMPAGLASKITAAKGATTSPRYAGLQMLKHMAGPASR